eukprot:5305102-Ditylum_brightwellii.AAC.1
MKKRGLNVPEYLHIQERIHHRNQPTVQRLHNHPLTGSVMTQYHVFKCLQLSGKDGLAAVDKKLRELVMRDVMAPLNPDKIKKKKKQDSLKYLMFPTKKRYGKIKGRGCADGCKQQSNTH